MNAGLRLRKEQSTARLAVAGLFQGFAGAEFRDARGRDVNLGAGARIAAGRGFALRDLKIAKAHDPDGIADFQSLLDIPERRINCLLRRVLRQIGILRHVGDKFSFVHGFILSLGLNLRRSYPPRPLGTLRVTNKWCMTEPKNAENQQKWSGRGLEPNHKTEAG